MNPILDETDLLPALYDGPFEQPMWQTFLDRLRQHTQADWAHISFRPPGHAQNSMIRLFSAKASVAAPPVSLFGDVDPVSLRDLRDERVYALSELRTPFGRWANRTHNDQHPAKDARILFVTEPGGLRAVLELSAQDATFAPADSALLSRMAPHLRRSLRSYAEIERKKASAMLVPQEMGHRNFGWIRLNADATISETSPEAQKLLQHGAGLKRTRSGRLIATNPQTDRGLSAALRAILSGGSAEVRALNISQDPWVDLLFVPAPPSSLDSGNAATVYIQGDNRSLSSRQEQLAELFGLLPSEARLAVALARGLTIAEAAQSLGLTIETARNYSKKVYAKTGVRGQADLVRFILTSVLAFA